MFKRKQYVNQPTNNDTFRQTRVKNDADDKIL